MLARSGRAALTGMRHDRGNIDRRDGNGRPGGIRTPNQDVMSDLL